MVADKPDPDFSTEDLSLRPSSRPPPRHIKKSRKGEEKNINGHATEPTEISKSAKRATPPTHDVSNAGVKRAKGVAKARHSMDAPAIIFKRTRRVKEDIFNEPSRLFGSAKSLLYHADTDLTGILYHPESIEALSNSELGWQFADDSQATIRHFADHFKAEGAQGQYDEEWLRDAMAAGKERAAGKFDEMLKEKFDQDWACESGEEYSEEDDMPALTVEQYVISINKKVEVEAKHNQAAEEDDTAD